MLYSTLPPDKELAALRRKRWEIEGALAELKTQLRGARMVLPSKTADSFDRSFGAVQVRRAPSSNPAHGRGGPQSNAVLPALHAIRRSMILA